MNLRSCTFWITSLLTIAMQMRMNAQELAMRQFTSEDGLPSLTLYNVMEFRNGSLCLTTTKGICSFNGKDFGKYNTRGLKSFDTPYSFIDRDGNPWFYNLAGEIFYIQADSLIRLNLDEYKRGEKIYSLFVANPYLYITWSNVEGQTSYRYHLNNLKDCKKLDRRYIYVGLIDGELYGYDLDKRRQEMLLYQVESDETCGSYPVLPSDDMNFIYEFDRLRKTQNGDIILVNSNYIRLLDSRLQLKKAFYYPPFSNQKIKYISIINDAEIFINTYGRSFVFNHVTGKLDESGYNMDFINDVFEDRYGRRWLTTNGHGLYLDLRNQIRLYTPENSALSSKDVSNIEVLGVDAYLCHNNGQVSAMREGKITEVNTLHGSGRIRFITEMHTGHQLAGHDQGIMFLRDAKAEHCNKLSIGSMKAAMVFSNDSVLLGTSLGVFSISKKPTDEWTCANIRISRELNDRTTCFNKVFGKVYGGTTNGMYHRTPQSDWVRSIPRGFYINDLFSQGDSTLWICTDGEGVFRFNGNTLTDSITTAQGLVSDNVSSMTADHRGILYIGTDNGITVWNPKSNDGFNLNDLDGLPGNEINDLRIIGKDLYIATPNGLCSIPIDAVNPNEEIPFVEVKEVEVFNRRGKTLFSEKLKHDENFVRFHLNGRSLISGEDFLIYYQMNDQKRWTQVHDYVLDFVGLTPGKYHVKFKGVNEDHLESKIISTHFEIADAFWKTKMFSGLMATVLIGISISITYLRSRYLRNKERKERMVKDQINTLREEALQSQMNPHFIFNALNAIQSYLSLSDQSNAMNYLSKFGKLIRMIFEQSRMKRVSLEDEISFIKNYLDLEKMRFRDKIEVHLEIAREVDERASDIQIPPLIIQPMIENAFKHGLLHKESGAQLNILMDIVDEQFVCSIEDNGIGRKASEKINAWRSKGRKSSGIASTLERLALLDQGRNKIGLTIIDLKDEEGNATGTKAIIKL